MTGHAATEPAAQRWDAIVIGTGVGGATLGYALARAGWKVLFCEKGKSHLGRAEAIRAAYPETRFARPEMPAAKHRAILAAAGRYCDELEDASTARRRAFVPFIGSGTGGSSALYGMAMERFFPSDFTADGRDRDSETTLPERWPISYADLAPYYRSAEALYRVRGEADPLRGDQTGGALGTPPALSAAGTELFEFLKSKRLHPYRLPLACEFVPDCRCCQGWLCDKGCKNDSARICLEPALTRHQAALLDECEVLRLEATPREVTGVVCAWRSQEITLRADIIVLAAGALETPRLLLTSTSASWPQGLANRSGLVGRNLMRHHVDLYLVATRASATSGPPERKELACSDFYSRGRQKLGTVQSFGLMPPAPLLSASLEDDLRNSAIPAAGTLFSFFRPLATRALSRTLSRRAALATVMEDLPYADNAVWPLSPATGRSARRSAIRYRIRPEGRARIRRFRSLMREVFEPYPYLLIKQAENNRMLAHVCGTCRFGNDPDKSVIDAHNRAHGLANLYVADSSFFPSSGGTNPSLTIAANALRVAARLTGGKANGNR